MLFQKSIIMSNKTNGIIYLIQPTELVGTNRYKVGCSSKKTLDRVKNGYKKGTRYLHISECKKPFEIESEIKKIFNEKYNLVAGKEYFEVDNESNMIEIFTNIIINRNKNVCDIKNINYNFDQIKDNFIKKNRLRNDGYIQKYKISDNTKKFLDDLGVLSCDFGLDDELIKCAKHYLKEWIDNPAQRDRYFVSLGQFSFCPNRKSGVYIDYPIYIDETINSWEQNWDEIWGDDHFFDDFVPSFKEVFTKYNNRCLGSIDIVCSHKGAPAVGFIIYYQKIDDKEILLDILSENNISNIYGIDAEWILKQPQKPEHIECIQLL